MKKTCLLAIVLPFCCLTVARAHVAALKEDTFCAWPIIVVGTIVDAESRDCRVTEGPSCGAHEVLLKVRADTVLRGSNVHPGDVIAGIARFSNDLPMMFAGKAYPMNSDGNSRLGLPPTGKAVDTAEARRELIGKQYIFTHTRNPGAISISFLPWLMEDLPWAKQHLARRRCNPVSLSVDAAMPAGKTARPWAFFGYDEPNYTYSPNGKKLLRELKQLSPVPVYIRAHNLLTSGDGTGALKWGSTNAYTEDAQGRPVYDWKVVDRIFDTYRDVGVRPLVEIGFMPEALTTGPAPYRHDFPRGSVFTGWSYPPKDYAKWAGLVFQFARHLRERYGDEYVKTWLWEVWNEPDIPYWHGTAEEFFRLYDVSADAVLRAVPFAQIGGPDSTGPASPKAEEFLRQFLEHCARGKNYATGTTGSPLAYIAFHPKGHVRMVDEHIQMGMANQLRAADAGFKIVASFPEWKNTPIILGENDPEGCAACTPPEHPENAYRNSGIYAVYAALEIKKSMELAAQRGVTLKGAVTWAFQFDGQPYFAGLRELATNGIDKPVLNGFRMLGMLGETELAVATSEPVSADAVTQSGVPEPVIDAIAARKAREVEVLIMYYRDDDVSSPAPRVPLTVTGIPASKVRVEEYPVGPLRDAYWLWQSMGSPQKPTAKQYKQLVAAGKLQRNGPPQTLDVVGGTLNEDIYPLNIGLTLIRVSW
jgi:xylan 1,4-beta-xylosidase